MKYTILIYENEVDFATRSDEKRKEAYWGAYRAYTQALTQAGVMIGGAGLQLPGRATTIRLRAGKRQVQDGPFAEAKEQLGGYYVIDVPDLDGYDRGAPQPAQLDGPRTTSTRFFFLRMRRPPRSTRFPYTTLNAIAYR